MNLQTFYSNINQTFTFSKVPAGSAGIYISLLRLGNNPPANLTVPHFSGFPGTGSGIAMGTGRVPYNCIGGFAGIGSTGGVTGIVSGCVPLQWPASGNLYLAKVEVSSNVANSTLIIYDRLWHASGFNTRTGVGVTGTGQAVVNFGTLPPRDIYGTSSGFGCEIWGELTMAATAPNGNWIVNYTDSLGVQRQAIHFKSSAYGLHNMIPFFNASGANVGVSSIQSFSATGGTTANTNLSLVVLRRIAELPIRNANEKYVYNALALGKPVIPSGAALFMMSYGATTLLNGTLQFSKD